MAAEHTEKASLENKLKSLGVKHLEEAIAKAVSELIGTAYNCSIQTIAYRTFARRESAKLKLTLSEAMDFSSIRNADSGNKTS